MEVALRRSLPFEGMTDCAMVAVAASSAHGMESHMAGFVRDRPVTGDWMAAAQEAAVSTLFPLPSSATISRESIVEECVRSSGRGMVDVGAGGETLEIVPEWNLAMPSNPVRYQVGRGKDCRLDDQSSTVDMFWDGAAAVRSSGRVVTGEEAKIANQRAGRSTTG